MQEKQERNSNYPDQKYTIIGAGIISYLSVYYLWKQAQAAGQKIRVTTHERNKSILHTTTANIFPSLTIDEIMSVVPPSPELLEKLQIKFNQPGGIRVEDVEGIIDSKVYNEFLNAVKQYGLNPKEYIKRVDTLFQLGRMSMNAWQEMYDTADEELKDILRKSNFQPCREPLKEGAPELHDGYRIDLIYDIPSNDESNNALKKAKAMCDDYAAMGYKHCDVLTPDEVEKRDPYLADFCKQQSELKDGVRVWKKTAGAVWRPGGCIDTRTFLPLFQDYLTKVMGKYTNADGVEKDCFRVKFDKNLEGVTRGQQKEITGLKFFDKEEVKSNKHTFPKSDYLVTTGDAPGTLAKLGFSEPEYTRFAGASLVFDFEIPVDKLTAFRDYNHCMEVHKEGVVLAWQGRALGNRLRIGVAGTKAFYGDIKPKLDDEFAKDRNLLQLNMVNEVLPEFISIALKRDTKGILLEEADLSKLIQNNIVKRWVGTRSATYDGFPTIGQVAPNCGTITHLGSGGASFSHAAIKTFFNMVKPDEAELRKQTMEYADPNRTFRV